MKRILTFKHWQLFLLTVLPGMWTSPSPIMEIINSFAIVVFSIWIYAVGFHGQERAAALGLPTLSLRLFKVNTALLPVLTITMLVILPKYLDKNSSNEISAQTALLLPLAFYLFFAGFHTIYFAGKTLATLELKREVHFGDYFLNSFLIVVFIIGVWILQPKATRLISDNIST